MAEWVWVTIAAVLNAVGWTVAGRQFLARRAIQKLRREELADPLLRELVRQRDRLMRERDEARQQAGSLLEELGEANLRAYEAGRLWRANARIVN